MDVMCHSGSDEEDDGTCHGEVGGQRLGHETGTLERDNRNELI